MPLRDIEHASSSAKSNELIEWQTGKLFAYLTLRNSRMNVTFMPGFFFWFPSDRNGIVKSRDSSKFSLTAQRLARIHDKYI